MAYKVTSINGSNQPEIMVDDAIIDGTMTAIKNAVGDVPTGTIIYTAGYAKIKQKALDGSWVEVE